MHIMTLKTTPRVCQVCELLQARIKTHYPRSEPNNQLKRSGLYCLKNIVFKGSRLTGFTALQVYVRCFSHFPKSKFAAAQLPETPVVTVAPTPTAPATPVRVASSTAMWPKAFLAMTAALCASF